VIDTQGNGSSGTGGDVTVTATNVNIQGAGGIATSANSGNDYAGAVTLTATAGDVDVASGIDSSGWVGEGGDGSYNASGGNIDIDVTGGNVQIGGAFNLNGSGNGNPADNDGALTITASGTITLLGGLDLDPIRINEVTLHAGTVVNIEGALTNVVLDVVADPDEVDGFHSVISDVTYDAGDPANACLNGQKYLTNEGDGTGTGGGYELRPSRPPGTVLVIE